MEKVLYVQGSTDVYEIVVINNNPQCNCQAADFGILCKHVTALFAGDFSAVINQDAIEEIKPILTKHPALADLQQIKNLQQEKNKILKKIQKEKLKIDNEIKSIKKDIFKKLHTNQ